MTKSLLPLLKTRSPQIEAMNSLKCLCIENFEYFFPTEIENLVFLVHDYHIFFALAGEKGIEISVCFEALDANFWWPLRDVIPRIKARTFSRPTEVC